MPRRSAIKLKITGLRRGEEIRKDITAPNCAPALSKPSTIGIVEHEQKGVSAPKPAPGHY